MTFRVLQGAGGAGIVRDNLVAHYDTGVPASDPGMGAVLYDLSPTGADMAYAGSPLYADGRRTFIGDTNGDGTPSVVDCAWVAGETAINFSGAISVEAWLRFDVFSDQQWNLIGSKWFIDHNTGTNGSNAWHFAAKDIGAPKLNLYTSSKSDMYGNTVLTTGSFYQVGFAIDSSGNPTFYLNGASDGTNTAAAQSGGTDVLQMGDGRGGALGASRSSDTTWGIYRIYDTDLSAAQWDQNFQANRARFGI